MSGLLTVRGLTVSTGQRQLLRALDLEIRRGQRIGLIGESGSGKSLTCLAIMGLTAETLTVDGSIELEGEGEILGLPDQRMARLRGRRISMVFQEPMTALNPLMRVGEQVAEIMSLHRTFPDPATRAVELLNEVRIPDPGNAARAYPHELSGGQRQRVMLAMALANAPDILLADEPTTALDATVQSQVLDLMTDQVSRLGTSMLLVSHDLGVVASRCERVVILRHGEIVESGNIDRVFTSPRHPYTRGLLAASALATNPTTGRLVTVEDLSLPTLRRPGEGAEEAAPTPLSAVVEPPHEVLTDGRGRFNAAGDGATPILRVERLTRTYRRRLNPFGRVVEIEALREVSFDVSRGQRFGIVGESGSGKSTLLRILTGLDDATAGRVEVAGREITGKRERELRWLRTTAQIVFQDPMGSLDPSMRVRDIISEPLRGVSREERYQRVETLLDSVGLPRSAATRHPHRFSGGERQRIAIARALVTEPDLLLADEAVSALDVSVRAQVLNLLDEIITEKNLTMVLVTHDLHVVRHACDVIAVMREGRIVECGPTEAVFTSPLHPHTQNLIEAMPSIARA